MIILNKYPLWKNIIIALIIGISFIYAAPNIFGEDPAVQVSATNPGIFMDATTADTLKNALQRAHINYKSLQLTQNNILLRFFSTDAQLQAKELIQQVVGENGAVALNLAPATPRWLQNLNALPMRYGLDLRGGVYFLLQVDVDSVLKQRIDGDLRSVGQALRGQRIRYADLTRVGDTSIALKFNTADTLAAASKFLSQHFPELTWTTKSVPAATSREFRSTVPTDTSTPLRLYGTLSSVVLQQARQDTLDQAMNTLRNRVNELGVSEAVVQQQGNDRVAVDLPGIQDTVQAKNILGKTATLEFHLVDTEHDARDAMGGVAPAGTRLYYDSGRPVLLKNEIILRGSAITSARSGFSDDGQPAVDVRLGGGGEELFTRTTAENIGKPMAVLYVEVKSTTKNVNGHKVIAYQTQRNVISVATIQAALANTFQVTGLANQKEARTLALLLRAGALPAPVTIIAERQVGPSLGKQNIHMGVLSVEVGFMLVVLFMAVYYGVFGLIADLALATNLVLIVAILSILGATLTLPGIAGVVLTVGMAADANVLIFERIREELRNGLSIQASIHTGYERAFVTIIDANVTTLIVAVILFSLGSGAVKAFAVTLTIGLVTSMFTAIAGTRAVVNWLYGGSRARGLKKISIGL